ncbi:MAG: glycosyltransferase [Gammaproteobacteria bacterium]|nr:glycosyltransferase [Gammaproteobacteria bacterium]
MQNNVPRVAVLLAAYNGEQWIRRQLDSIWSQECVMVDVFVSLDVSSDSTLSLLQNLKFNHNNLFILPYGERFGGAAKNFYRLIKDVDVSAYDYVAFADQDDIWLPRKLYRGVEAMQSFDSKAYSSDVMAFWSNGRQKLIKKSYHQKRFDFIFESAGPGCTYVFRVEPFLDFQDFVISNWTRVLEIEFHDWLAYSFFRSRGHKWLIDISPMMLYRQHENNQFGANSSWAAYLSRLNLIKDGWYALQVRTISRVLGLSPPSKRFIFSNFMQTRRKKLDAISMLIFCWFF